MRLSPNELPLFCALKLNRRQYLSKKKAAMQEHFCSYMAAFLLFRLKTAGLWMLVWDNP